MNVAIDGPAGVGKSTVARTLAQRLGLTFLDTGAMYRAVALAALEQGLDLDDGASLGALSEGLDLEMQPAPAGGLAMAIAGRDVGEAIRRPDVSAAASRVARHAEVRTAMVEQQRRLADALGGVVAEGRDIGTVVFPNAPWKFFLEATPEERARRRFEQTAGQPDAPSYDKVLEALKQRDDQDRNRAVSPLRPADDAHIIDTTQLSVEGVLEEMVRILGPTGCD